MEKRKRIFEYDNYRLFLKDSYFHLKNENKKFSFRYFSRLAGFKSPNILKRVMEGQRNLSPQSIPKFVQALKLNKEEALFFKNLVMLNQAKTNEAKQIFSQEILSSRTFREIYPLSEAQYNYFAKWYYIPIREFVGLSSFKEDHQLIADSLVPPISALEAKHSIEELLKIGLLERNSEGKLQQANAITSTPAEVTSTAVIKYHKETTKKAADSIETIPRELRDISAVAFPVSKQTLSKIKELMQTFRKEIVELAAQDSAPDSIYQINFQLFPLVFSEMEKK
ncbi:MAG: TIGR02147 family protein [Pseudobdellovibrionaceae bacterium]